MKYSLYKADQVFYIMYDKKRFFVLLCPRKFNRLCFFFYENKSVINTIKKIKLHFYFVWF